MLGSKIRFEGLRGVGTKDFNRLEKLYAELKQAERATP